MNCEEFIISTLTSLYEREGAIYNSSNDLRGWLIDHFNYTLRQVIEKPRVVHFSNKVNEKLLEHPELQSAVNTIAAKSERGFDLKPYLSKNIRKTDYNDSMFNDWNIHHLHIEEGQDTTDPYFIARADYLLFARFDDEDVYFIDIISHKDRTKFSRREIIEVLQQNWNHILEPYEAAEDVVGICHNRTDEEIHCSRRSGVMSGIEVNGKVYIMLGDGYATNGDNAKAVRLTLMLLRYITTYEEDLKNNLENHKPNLLRQLGFAVS